MKKSTYNSRFVLTGVAAAVMMAAGGNVMAADNTEAQYVIDIPQIIEVTDSGGVEAATAANAESAIQNVAWTVKSNNAVVLAFTGSHEAADGTVTANPAFHKPVQDSQGNNVSNQFDLLTTKFAVRVTGAEETNGFETPNDEGTDGQHDWGTTTDPNKTPANLVSTDASPDATYGRIMPNDGNGTLVVTLYATGEDDEAGDYSKQSGDYEIDVTLTVSGEEQIDDL